MFSNIFDKKFAQTICQSMNISKTFLAMLRIKNRSSFHNIWGYRWLTLSMYRLQQHASEREQKITWGTQDALRQAARRARRPAWASWRRAWWRGAPGTPPAPARRPPRRGRRPPCRTRCTGTRAGNCRRPDRRRKLGQDMLLLLLYFKLKTQIVLDISTFWSAEEQLIIEKLTEEHFGIRSEVCFIATKAFF